MAVITISRESGARGSEIGRLLAKSLGYRYVGREAIHEICTEYGVRQDEFEYLYEHAPGLFERYDHRNREIVQMITHILQSLARRDSMVIVSRDGFDALHDVADVLHVRITARPELRAKRIQHDHDLKPKEAEAMLDRLDKERSKYVSAFHGLDWADAALYDLCVNTGKIDTEHARDLILQALAYLKQDADPERARASDLEADLILERAIDEAFNFIDTISKDAQSHT